MDYRLGRQKARSPLALVGGRYCRRRLHLRIELSSPDAADMVGALDAAGERIALHTVSGQYHSSAMRMGIENGRTQTLAVSERARTLVFYKDGEEVERLPLSLLPQTVNEIRW